eukprot:6491092-Amphidinium_carterae.1
MGFKKVPVVPWGTRCSFAPAIVLSDCDASSGGAEHLNILLHTADLEKTELAHHEGMYVLSWLQLASKRNNCAKLAMPYIKGKSVTFDAFNLASGQVQGEGNLKP